MNDKSDGNDRTSMSTSMSMSAISNLSPNYLLKIPQCYYDEKHSGWCYMQWGSLHSTADSFPEKPTEEQKDNARSHVHTTSQLLPCQKCQVHMTTYLKVNPVNVNSGSEFSKWMWDFHNDVRRRLGEPILTDEEAQAAQDWIRSIKWSAVERDLKTNCSRLCSHSSQLAGASKIPVTPHNDNNNNDDDDHDDNTNSSCTNVDRPQNFRLFGSDNPGSNTSKNYSTSRTKINLLILFLILTICALMASIAYILYTKRNSLYTTSSVPQHYQHQKDKDKELYFCDNDNQNQRKSLRPNKLN